MHMHTSAVTIFLFHLVPYCSTDTTLSIPHNDKSDFFFGNLPSKGDSFSRNTFLKTAITKNGVGVVVEEFEARAVVCSSQLGFGSSQTNSVGNTCFLLKQKKGKWLEPVNILHILSPLRSI